MCFYNEMISWGLWNHMRYYADYERCRQSSNFPPIIHVIWRVFTKLTKRESILRSRWQTYEGTSMYISIVHRNAIPCDRPGDWCWNHDDKLIKHRHVRFDCSSEFSRLWSVAREVEEKGNRKKNFGKFPKDLKKKKITSAPTVYDWPYHVDSRH